MVLVDRLRIEAMVSADPDGLELVLHDDLIYRHANGRIDTKRSLIDKLVSGEISYLVVESDALTSRRHDGAAVVTGPVHMEVAAGGEPRVLDSLYTAVYWNEDGRWQLVVYHSNPAP